MLLAGMICVGFAAGDEYHQSFISGRSPSVRDVGIDSFGIFWGIILVRIIGWTGRKTIFRPRKKKVKTKKVKKYNNKNYNYNDTYHYNEEEDLPPYNPGGNYPPYPEQPRYQAPPSNWKQPVFRDEPPYQQQPPFQEYPPYQEQAPYDMPPQIDDEDFDYEETDSDEKEPFFMKSAYDGKPKPYDPKDPFQDWMDDYFPEDKDSSK